MSIKALQEYTRFSKYAKYIPEKKRRETWNEQVERVMQMHRNKFSQVPDLKNDIDFVEQMFLQKRVLGSQRALQFGGKPIIDKNARLYNCFARETEFITSHGVKSFNDFEDGDTLFVQTHLGHYKLATVHNYGKQKLNKISFARGGSKIHEVYATGNHRWLLNKDIETTNIQKYNSLRRPVSHFNEFDYDSAPPLEKLYWAYGLVYGDGTIFASKTGGIKSYSMIRLCSDDKRYQARFEELGFSTSTSASLKGDFMAFTGTYLKTLPDPTKDSIELLRAFVRGFLDADGSKTSKYCSGLPGTIFNGITQHREESQDFIRRIFPVVGVYITSETTLHGETNLGSIEGNSFFRISTTIEGSSPLWQVRDIEQNIREEDVWCLEVEDDHSFVMPSGIVTGNCTASYVDRPRFFQEVMYVLLCGCGAGFSVQKHHIDKLPVMTQVRQKDNATYIVPDSIEGWSDAVGVLISSFCKSDAPFPEYMGKNVIFDFSLIRPAGAPISHGGKAPGPDGLRASLEKIRKLLAQAVKGGDRKLRPIEAYDIVMHVSDSVLSGGVRRSACICLFSFDDEEMIKAKTGAWQHENPHRARSNNSVLLVRGNTTQEQFSKIMESVREFGEPGFIWANDTETVFNPCAEISMVPSNEKGESGWQFCNLCEINLKKAKTEAEFLESCRAAAILGTLQASYTDFSYLGPITEEIVRKEALLGVSMTGMMDTPEIAFDAKIQRKGAQLILGVNERIAKLIGINIAARATCVKPAGTSSCILGTSSGIHPHHARRYFRHVQANRMEPALQFFQTYNPVAIEESVWSASNTDVVIKFLCEVPVGSVTKNQVDAIKLLEYVKSTQQNWVEAGTRPNARYPLLRHNVSNTINVMPEEWKGVEKYIFKNREWFAGISLLPVSGDKDYAQAPFTAVYTASEIVDNYGDGALFASGLIVDGLRCFNDDLWKACDTILGIGIIPLEVYYRSWKKYMVKGDQYDKIRYRTTANKYVEISGDRFRRQQDWIRRATQFADRYFQGDIRVMTYCLKDIRNWKVWCDLKREYKDVDWEKFIEDTDETKIEQTVACAGGQCSII